MNIESYISSVEKFNLYLQGGFLCKFHSLEIPFLAKWGDLFTPTNDVVLFLIISNNNYDLAESLMQRRWFRLRAIPPIVHLQRGLSLCLSQSCALLKPLDFDAI